MELQYWSSAGFCWLLRFVSFGWTGQHYLRAWTWLGIIISRFGWKEVGTLPSMIALVEIVRVCETELQYFDLGEICPWEEKFISPTIDNVCPSLVRRIWKIRLIAIVPFCNCDHRVLFFASRKCLCIKFWAVLLDLKDQEAVPVGLRNKNFLLLMGLGIMYFYFKYLFPTFTKALHNIFFKLQRKTETEREKNGVKH